MPSGFLAGLRGDFEVFRATYHPGRPRPVAVAAFVAQPATGFLLLARVAAAGPKVISLIARRFVVHRYASDVEHGARIAPGLLIAHPVGIVIGGGVSIERGVKLHQHVTLGVHHGGAPRIGTGVYVFAGAVIVGPVTVGSGARIGANAYVCADVPAAGVVPAATRWTRRAASVPR